MYLSKPIFLLSSERSGSNLIRAIMGAHPHISAPPPPHILSNFFPLLPYYGRLEEEDHFRHLCDDVASSIANQLSKWETTCSAEDLAANVSARDLPGILDYVYYCESQQDKSALRTFFKEIDTHEYLFQLLRAYPNATFIYLVRDPRDFVLSSLNSPNHPGSLEEFSVKWAREQSKMLSLLCQLFLENKVYAVHYEDLLANPADVVRAICSFINEAFDTSMLEFFKRERTQGEARDVKNWSNLGKPVQSGNYQKFMEELNREQIEQIEEITWREMMLADYPMISANLSKSSKRGLGDKIRKGGQLAAKMMRGNWMPIREMSTRSKQIQTRNQIQQRLSNQVSPLIKRQYATYDAAL